LFNTSQVEVRHKFCGWGTVELGICNFSEAAALKTPSLYLLSSAIIDDLQAQIFLFSRQTDYLCNSIRKADEMNVAFAPSWISSQDIFQ